MPAPTTCPASDVPAVARYERCAVLMRKADEFAYISLAFRQGDSLRHLAIHGRIGRIESPHGCVEMKHAFEFSGKSLEIGETW